MTTMHHGVVTALCFVLGSCFGSFLNVCIYRIPRRMSLLRPSSRCPRCGFAILARHNVPVLGWLILRGRCHGCRLSISPRYPAIELTVAMLFAVPYVVAVSACSGDPWEQIGVSRMALLMAASWSMIGLGVFAIVTGSDTRWSFSESPPEGRHRPGVGCEVPAASVPRM